MTKQCNKAKINEFQSTSNEMIMIEFIREEEKFQEDLTVIILHLLFVSSKT